MGSVDTTPETESFARIAWRWFRSKGNAWCTLVAAAAPLVLYHRVALLTAHFWGDTTNAYWPDLAFFTRSLAEGQLPLWNPDDRGGFPFAFDPQPGVLHPLNWVFVLVGLVLGKVPYMLFQYKILAHLSITCVGWLGWLSQRVKRPAALVGALGATFGCYTLQHAHYGLIWPIAFVPWFLTALDHWVASRSRSAAVGMAASVGAMMAAGSPPAALYGSIVCAAFGLPRVVAAFVNTARGSRTELRNWALSAALGLTIAVLLCVPVILGSAHLTATSILEKRDFAYVSSGSLATKDLLAFLLPSASGAIVYLGVCVAVLALVGASCRLFEPTVLVATLLAVFGVLLALGVNTPVLGAFVKVFPPARYFRLVFRYLYLTQVGLGVLAAYGTQALLAHRRSWLLGMGVLLVFTAFTWMLWRLTATAEEAPKIADEMRSLTRYLAFVCVLGLLCRIPRMGSGFAWLFGALALVDYTTYVPRSNVLRSGSFELPRNISPAWQKAILEDAPQHRVWDEFGFGFRAGSRLGIRDLRGYMDPLRLATYEKMASQLIVSPELLARWGVRFVLPADHPYVGSGHKRVNYARLRSAIRREAHVLELPEARSPGFFTDFFETRSTDGAWRALEANPLGARLQLPASLANAQCNFAIPDVEAQSHPIRERAARLIKRRNNRLEFTIEAPKSGWFVVNEAYFPGWKAWVDGKLTSIYRVDGWIRGLPITQGTHHIVMKFIPTGWLIFASITVCVWVALGAFALRKGLAGVLQLGRRRYRERPRTTVETRPNHVG